MAPQRICMLGPGKAQAQSKRKRVLVRTVHRACVAEEQATPRLRPPPELLPEGQPLPGASPGTEGHGCPRRRKQSGSRNKKGGNAGLAPQPLPRKARSPFCRATVPRMRQWPMLVW